MTKYSLLLPILMISFLFTTAGAHARKGYDSLGIDTVSGRIFACGKDRAGIDVIDIQSGRLTTILPHKEIRTIALDEQGRILGSIEEDESLHIISMETFETLASIRVKDKPTALAIDSNLGLAVVALAEGKIDLVDLNMYAILAEIKVLNKPVSVAIDPQLHLAIVVHDTWSKGDDIGCGDKEKRRDNVTIIDLVSRSVIKTVQAGKNPVRAAVNPTTHEAAVANEKSNDLTLIDLTDLSIKANIPVGKHPRSLAYNECLNTLSIIGGEDKGWLYVIDTGRGENEAYNGLEGRPEVIKVHRYLNVAIISGKRGLSITDLPNPIPRLMSINPEKTLRGEESLDFLLSGGGMLSVTSIYLNGNEASTTFPGCGAISVAVPAGYVQKAGEMEITAVNPLPGGGTSNPLYLKIENPVPTLSVLDPMEIEAGAREFLVTGYGTGFFDDTTVYINGLSRPLTRINQRTIQIQLTAEDLEFGRYLEIAASNPLPGGGLSNPEVFKVLNAIPELTSINPATIVAGRPDFILSVMGDNFVKTSVVGFDSRQYPVKYVSKTQVEVGIPADAVNAPGSYPVEVINPAPGGGKTQTLMVTVKPPLDIKITSPADGEVVNQARTIVKGIIESDTNDLGVLVNGILAEARGKEWVVNGVPLVLGTNTITATITDRSGNTASSSIVLNTNAITRQVRLSANITSGLAPFTSFFSVVTEMYNPVSRYEMDFDGDGVIDYTGATFEDVGYTFETEGFFYPTIWVTDGEGNTYSDTIAITAFNISEIEDVLKQRWEGLKRALKEKNTEEALGYFIKRSKERYGRIFDALKDQLATILDTFVEFNITDYYDNVAEYEIVADENGVLYSYPGLFVKNGSGIWKFHDF